MTGQTSVGQQNSLRPLRIHSSHIGVRGGGDGGGDGGSGSVLTLKMLYVPQLLMGSRHKKDVVKQQSFRHHLIHDVVYIKRNAYLLLLYARIPPATVYHHIVLIKLHKYRQILHGGAKDLHVQ